MGDEQQEQHASLRRDRTQTKISCVRCRDQKLKCSRQLPSCIRCRRQNIDCTYPSPPDRRRIAQRVSEAKASGSLSSNLDPPSHRRALSDTRISEALSNKSEDYVFVVVPSPCRRSSDSTSGSDFNDIELPSTEIGFLLLEIYFKRVYNATLLFHKAIVFDLYRQNGIPEYLLRAIFAHAAVFLQDIGVSHTYKDQIRTISMHTIFERSWSWARCASKEVLSSADEPTLARIQTLQVLQLYYFSRGDFKRAKIHVSLAYQLGQVLEYASLREESIPAAANQHQMFEYEMERRCFWAIWCSISLGEPVSDFEAMRDKVMGLPLPAKLEASGLVQGKSLDLGPKMIFDWESACQPHTLSEETSPNSFMVELIKFLGFWMNVKEFISDFPSLVPDERLSRFERLIARANSVHSYSNLTIANISSKAEFYDESPELLVSIYSAHLLSQVLLHATMASSLHRMIPNPFETDGLAQKTSMKVLEYASTFSKLSLLVLEQSLDITRLWPLTGFGAFVVGKVFAVYRHNNLQDNIINSPVRIPGPGSGEMKAVKTVFEVSSLFWKPLRDFADSTKTFNSLDSIVSLMYPWGEAYPERAPENSTNNQNYSNAATLRSPSLHSSPPSDEPPIQGSSQHAIGVDISQSAGGQPTLLYNTSSAEGSYSDAFNCDDHALEGDVFMNDGDRNLTSDTNWWGINDHIFSADSF